MLDHFICVCSVVLNIFRVPKTLHQFTLPTRCETASWPTFFANSWYCQSLTIIVTNISHFVVCLLYLMVVSMCISLLTKEVEYFFYLLIVHFDVLFYEMTVLAFCPFFYWIVWIFLIDCRSCLRILDVSHLSIMWSANIFSHSVMCSFMLFTVKFDKQNFLM